MRTLVLLCLVLLATAARAHNEFEPCPVFPQDNAWNTPVDDYPLHPRSAELIERMGPLARLHPEFGTVWEGVPNGIPYNVLRSAPMYQRVDFAYPRESDRSPWPIPAAPQIEGGADRHLLIVDARVCLLYEMFGAQPPAEGEVWRAGSGAIFDLRSNYTRPDGWTSADAAGLPILPGLVRYHEVVEHGRIDHALRFTVPHTAPAWIPPARHWATHFRKDLDLPPMGLRVRLRADWSCADLSREAQVICAALKRYGMILADNGGRWFLSGAPDPRWDDEALGDLKRIPGSAFEVVFTGDARRIPLER